MDLRFYPYSRGPYSRRPCSLWLSAVALTLACNNDPAVLTGTGTTTGGDTTTGPPPDPDTSTGVASSSGGADTTTGGSTDTTGGSTSTGEPPIQDMGCPECTVLVTGLVGGRGLFLTDEWVYYTDQDAGTVSRVAKSGGEEPELIADNQMQPYGVVATEEQVYWSTFVEMGTLQRRSLSGGPVFAVAADANPRFLQLVGDWIYWCSFDDVLGRVRRVSAIGVGNPPETLVSVGSGVADLVVVDDMVYFTVHLPPAMPGLAPEGLVYAASSQVPTDEADLRALATEQAEPWGIAHYRKRIFWINGIGDPPDLPRRVLSSSIHADDQEPTTLALQQDNPWGIAVDDTYVYWTDYIEVWAVSHAGGDEILLADLQNVARSIEVDEDYVYWITKERVLQRPKP